MGQCGCGDCLYKIYKITEDRYLAIEYYRGCNDCGTSPTIGMYLLTKKQYDGDYKYFGEVIDWRPDEEPEGNSFQCFNFPGTEEIFKAIDKREKTDPLLIVSAKDADEAIEKLNDGEDHYEGLNNYWYDNGYEILRDSFDYIKDE